MLAAVRSTTPEDFNLSVGAMAEAAEAATELPREQPPDIHVQEPPLATDERAAEVHDIHNLSHE